MTQTFPQTEWEQKPPADLGFDPEKLVAVEAWYLESSGGVPCRVAIARHGHLTAEWGLDVDPRRQQRQASAAKSFYSCLLGIAVAEGKLKSPDEKVIDHYPEMMDVAEDEGPKPGRYAFEKDRDITFRQLICNTSGYMKPGEEPGTIFHYQTYGMNILTHALASIYGLYDSADPDRLPGCGKLLEDKIRNPIGASWSYTYTNFQLQPKARLNIFGNYLQMQATAYDLLRAGHLWLNGGVWDGVQVVPGAYLKEATVTNPDILAHEPEENWKYGHGFWVNDHGKLWPDLPRDTFAASGAGAKHTWVCPSLDLVVVQNPGPWEGFKEEKARTCFQNESFVRITDAIRS